MKRKLFWAVAAAIFLTFAGVSLALSLLVDQDAMRAGLERELGREVEFESLRLRILPRPGLYAKRFVLRERPEFGAEPFLYARTMRCFLPLGSLWRWRFECGQVQLIEPSLNLTRSPEGDWNLSKFGFAATAGADSGRLDPLPRITIVDGRVNFKDRDRKLRFALTGVRMRLEPAGNRRWSIRLDARPFRADIDLGPTADIRIRGEIDAALEGPARFRLEAGWDASSIEQWVALVRGAESPLRAGVQFDLTVEGTPAEWSGRGEFALAGLRHRDKASSESGSLWKGDVSVCYQAEGDFLEIADSTIEGEGTVAAFTGSIRDPFGAFDWSLDASAKSVDLGELWRQFTALTTTIPSETVLTGDAPLTFHAESDRAKWRGELQAGPGLGFNMDADSPPVELAQVRLELDAGKLALHPMVFRFGSGATISGQGEVDLTDDAVPYRVSIASPGVDVALLARMAGALGWTYPASDLAEGNAEFELAWSGEVGSVQPPRWDGAMTLTEGRLVSTDLGAPLEIPLAPIRWTRGTLAIGPGEVVVGADTLNFTLEKRIDRPYWTVGLDGTRLDLGALHTLLHGEGEGLLDQLLGGERARQIPWDEFWLQGTATVKEVVAGPVTLTRLDARGEMRLGRLTLDRLRFRVSRGRFDGDLRGDFLESPPRYRLAGNLRRVRLGELLAGFSEQEPLLTGLLGAEILLESAGDDMDGLWRNLHGAVVGGVRDGHWTGLNILPALTGVVAAASDRAGGDGAGTTEFQSLSGNLRLGNRTVETDELRMIVGGAALDLSGSAQFDGALDFRLTGRPLRVGRRRPSAAQVQLFRNAFRLTGTARSPQVDVELASDTPD